MPAMEASLARYIDEVSPWESAEKCAADARDEALKARRSRAVQWRSEAVRHLRYVHVDLGGHFGGDVLVPVMPRMAPLFSRLNPSSLEELEAMVKEELEVLGMPAPSNPYSGQFEWRGIAPAIRAEIKAYHKVAGDAVSRLARKARNEARAGGLGYEGVQQHGVAVARYWLWEKAVEWAVICGESIPESPPKPESIAPVAAASSVALENDGVGTIAPAPLPFPMKDDEARLWRFLVALEEATKSLPPDWITVHPFPEGGRPQFSTIGEIKAACARGKWGGALKLAREFAVSQLPMWAYVPEGPEHPGALAGKALAGWGVA